MTTEAAERSIDQQQWSWWCMDNKVLEDRGLGNANCIVCAQEPTRVLAWRCEPPCQCHADPDTAIHVKFEGCGHRVDVRYTEEAAQRMYG